jgi:hypothetical protein
VHVGEEQLGVDGDRDRRRHDAIFEIGEPVAAARSSSHQT